MLMLALGEQLRRQDLEPARRRRAARNLHRDVDDRHHRGRTRSRICCSNSSSRMSASGALMGNYDATERLLQQYLPPERVGGIMDEIRGPAGRNMWEKLANVQEEVLANYLKNEYPQTVAVVLSKLRPGARRARARDPARGLCARRRQPHAEDGGGAEGSDRAASSRRCAPNSCRTCRRPAGATRTR